MRDPFDIHGPAVISFSGGRTSAYMLHRIMLNGQRDDVHVLFANTGRERPETLDFVERVAKHEGVHVEWLEYRAPTEFHGPWDVVSHRSASRAGEPFDALIAHRRRLPNPTMRFCTQELKIRPMREWMKSLGYEHWTMVVGIRADEPRRVARMEGLNDQAKERWTTVMPLARAGVTLADVDEHWRRQSFDLGLRPWEGNCDMCFLKSVGKRVRIARDRPDLVGWWDEHEQRNGQPFRRDTPSYAAIAMKARLPMLFDATDLGDCFCGD